MNEDKKKAGQPLWVDPKQNNRSVVPHGFRSSFEDWAHESTNFPNHVIEMALAHKISDKVEAAYRRGDLFAKRRELMKVWARYCASAPVKRTGDVVPLHQGRR